MAAAEIGSFPPGVKRFFLLGAPIIALNYLLDTSEHLYGYP